MEKEVGRIRAQYTAGKGLPALPALRCGVGRGRSPFRPAIEDYGRLKPPAPIGFLNLVNPVNPVKKLIAPRLWR